MPSDGPNLCTFPEKCFPLVCKIVLLPLPGLFPLIRVIARPQTTGFTC